MQIKMNSNVIRESLTHPHPRNSMQVEGLTRQKQIHAIPNTGQR